MSGVDAARNLGSKAARRLQSLHKPIVRLMRRSVRAREHQQFRRDAAQVDRAIASIGRSGGPIVAGPWLAEVGYEVLYWIPFLRWFCDAYGIPRERLTVISRGGLQPLYGEFAGSYVDLFDILSPDALAQRNQRRRAEEEGGGQKQSGLGSLDEELIAAARTKLRHGAGEVLHPSLMFRLFRNVWHGNLPYDQLWRHTRYARPAAAPLQRALDLPADFVAVKLYTGPALSADRGTHAALRALVERIAQRYPVITLDADFGVDEHKDLDFSSIAGVTSAAGLMTTADNLAVQIAVVARSRFFLSTCGGLGWLAPFLGVATIAAYDDARLLAPHLYVARQAGAAAGAARFSPLDLNSVSLLDLLPR